jgi:hypothetical protein
MAAQLRRVAEFLASGASRLQLRIPPLRVRTVARLRDDCLKARTPLSSGTGRPLASRQLFVKTSAGGHLPLKTGMRLPPEKVSARGFDLRVADSSGY